MSSSESRVGDDGWDTFWRSAGDRGAYTDGEGAHPQIAGFWRRFFERFVGRGEPLELIDVASGNGAVIECVPAACANSVLRLTSVDISAAAIRSVERRFPGVRGVVADTRRMPFRSGSCDIVTSQFGLEYAGLDALAELIRLLGTRGELALLLHYRGGPIDAACRANLAAAGELQAAEFIEHSLATLEAGFAALRGGGRDAYRAAGKRLAPAIKAVERIIAQYGHAAAEGTIVRLYRDVRSIHEHMRDYEPADVKAWLGSMQAELDDYVWRMRAMCGAAVDEPAFERVRGRLAGAGFGVTLAAPLRAPGDAPVAWAILAEKL